MVFARDILNSVMKNSLELDCINITLTQDIATDPVIFKGPGTIFQDESGTIRLKMYHGFQDISKEIPLALELGFAPGKIIEDEHYYSLEAMDIHGNVWNAKRVSVNGDVLFPAAGRIIKTSLDEIVNTAEKEIASEKSLLALFAKGNYSFPCNKAEDLPGGGRSFNTSTFSIENIDFVLKKGEESLEIRAIGLGKDMPASLENHIIEALCIIFGRVVDPVCTIWSRGKVSETTIRSVHSRQFNDPLPAPIEHKRPDRIDDFIAFIGSYLHFFRDSEMYPPLFGYWHKISRAYQSEFETAALALTVSIEGVIKEYLQNYGHAEESFLKAAVETKKVIENLGLIERIRQLILQSLARLKRPTPKSALIDNYGI
jgi:hypothetical protein